MANKSWIYGVHTVRMLLTHHPERVLCVAFSSGAEEKKTEPLEALARSHHIPIARMSRSEMDAVAQGEVHQGVAAQCAPLPQYDPIELLEQLKEPPFLLMLDGIQDPHNLGACLRTAHCAGVHAVLIPQDRASGLTAVARKVASGAAELTPTITVKNLARTIAELKEYNVWFHGASGDAPQSVFDADLRGGICWVMGAEGAGLRTLTKQSCDVLVSIPMVGAVESLNVSVATGVVLYETLRQRKRS